MSSFPKYIPMSNGKKMPTPKGVHIYPKTTFVKVPKPKPAPAPKPK